MGVTDNNNLNKSVAATNPQAVEYFWNAYSNIQNQVGPLGGYDFNREQLTYIQADERYVSYTEQYADLQGLTGTARTELVDTARETHAASLDTLENSPGYSTDMQGLANDFYFVIEQSYPDSPEATVAEASPAVETPAVETPAVTVETPAVTTAMGDIAMPASVEVATVAAPVESVESAAKPYDASFTETQLGELGQAPEEGITETPTTEPIAIEDMPIPFSHEEKLEMGREQEDTPAAEEYTVQRGDSLEKIARNHYGIERGNFETNAEYRAAVQNAASHIASATGLIAHPNGKNYDLAEGANANHIFPGQTLQLPPAEALTSDPAKSLDYAALDAGGAISYSRSVLSPGFRSAAEGTTATTDTPALAQDIAAVADRRATTTVGASLTH